MMILEIALSVAMVVGSSYVEPAQPVDTTCGPDEVCYPIDPQDPKPVPFFCSCSGEYVTSFKDCECAPHD